MNAEPVSAIQLLLWPPSGQVSASPDSAFIPGAGPSFLIKGKTKKEYYREWRAAHPDRCKEARKRYRLGHPEMDRIYRQKHFAEMKIYQKAWRLKNPERVKRFWQNVRKKITLKGRLNQRMSAMVRRGLKGAKGKRCWQNLVGYSTEELKIHLELHFAVGMSWKNMGEWHIDHVNPQSLFHYEQSEDEAFKQCWALSNLQPLWAKDNLSKHDRTMEEWNQTKGIK